MPTSAPATIGVPPAATRQFRRGRGNRAQSVWQYRSAAPLTEEGGKTTGPQHPHRSPSPSTRRRRSSDTDDGESVCRMASHIVALAIPDLQLPRREYLKLMI